MTQLNLAGKITKFFLYNRPLTILVLLTTVFSGIFVYFITPKQYNPEITLPAFQISIPYPGATAEEVENLITRELEEKIADIEGVDKIFSRSIEGGVAIVDVQFKIGQDLEDAKVKVYNKIFENLDLKKGNIGEPLIKNINPDDVPIVTLGLTSSLLSQNEVRTLGIDIMNELKKVSDTANIEIHGGEKKALQIILDAGQMKSRKISVQDVKNAISASNLKISAGRIKDGITTHEIEIDGTFTNPEEVGKVLVATGIQLRDIANIRNGYTEKISFVEVFQKTSLVKAEKIKLETGQPYVFISIAKRKGSNSTTVAKNILKSIKIIL